LKKCSLQKYSCREIFSFKKINVKKKQKKTHRREKEEIGIGPGPTPQAGCAVPRTVRPSQRTGEILFSARCGPDPGLRIGQRRDAFFPAAIERAGEGDDATTGRELRRRTKPTSLERGGCRALELRVGGAGVWGAALLTGVWRCGCRRQRGMERGGG
jgi:hypothetical protein